MRIVDFLRPENWRAEGAGPRYVQLRRRIEEGIESGLLGPDRPLPPEREIAAVAGMSRVTVRKAIRELVDKGTIVQRQGSGSFIRSVVPRVERPISRLTSFSEDMARRGLETRSIWLERGIFMPSPEEIVALALSAGDSVTRIARLRQTGRQPIAIERASLPLDILPDPMLVRTSLYEVLERSGCRPVRAIQKISAINLNGSDAELLGVDAGAAGLSIERTSYRAEGRAVEFTRSVFRGDAYDFVAELRVSPI